MPLQECQQDGNPGYRWGSDGKCFTYTEGNDSSKERARDNALEQGRAIEASKKESKE